MTGKYVIENVRFEHTLSLSALTANVTGPDGITRVISRQLQYGTDMATGRAALLVDRMRDGFIFEYIKQGMKEAEEWRQQAEIEAIAGEVTIDRVPNAWLDELDPD